MSDSSNTLLYLNNGSRKCQNLALETHYNNLHSEVLAVRFRTKDWVFLHCSRQTLICV